MIKKKYKLTDERSNFKPFTYPWCYDAWLAHEQSHWLHSEVPMSEDVKDWKKKLTEEEKQRFIVVDNVSFGEFDFDILQADFEPEQLEDWGLVLPENISPDEFGVDFTLPDGDKAPFQQMTFTLADMQAEEIKGALELAKKDNNIETYGNENSNGNAIYRIVVEWEKQKK